MLRLMKTVFCLVGVLAVSAAAWGQDSRPMPKPLSEADVLKLVELQIDDGCIIGRVQKTGPDFKVDEVVVARLRKAGASDAVIEALKAGKTTEVIAKTEVPNPKKRTMMLWSKRYYDYLDNPLESEVRINGELVGTIKSESRKPLDKFLRKGWNTITVKTAPHLPANQGNNLWFTLGPVYKAPDDELVMERVYWSFNNGEGWHFKDGKFSHDLGPDTKEVTLTFKVYYAEPEYETKEVKNGDYVLWFTPYYDYKTSSVSTTVFVNGTPLNTGLTATRELVITPLLKKGENEIKVVTAAVPGYLEDNDTTVTIEGPAEYSAAQKKFLFNPLVEFKSIEGWVRDKKHGNLVCRDKPGAETIERTIPPVILDEAPKVK
jgi:hypothetical protein